MHVLLRSKYADSGSCRHGLDAFTEAVMADSEPYQVLLVGKHKNRTMPHERIIYNSLQPKQHP